MNNTVYKNASIVTGISVAERSLGFLYRIVLSRYIGAEGLGIYQVAHSLFALLLTLGTGGIPVTVSRMLAKSNAERKPQDGQAVLTAGLICALLLSLPFCLLLWLFGEKLPLPLSAEGVPVLKILLVGLCFACVYAVVRGYLWGNKRFLSASMLEMTEEVVMVLVGIFLLRGATTPAAGATRAAWACTVADILSCAVALVVLFCSGGRFTRKKPPLKPLFSATLPITSVRAGASLVNSAVAVLLPAMLVRAGATQAEALSLFGVVSGMVMPVLFIPSTLIGSLALVLVPELSADFYRRNVARLKGNIMRGLRFSFLIACALIPLFFTLGREVGLLAFASETAGEIIAKGCLILLPMSLTMISTSVLNSIGFEKQTFLFFFVGAAGLLLCVLLLPPLCGIYAYVVGLGVNYALTALCNLYFLYKKLKTKDERRGQGSVHGVLIPLIGILPLSLSGQLFLSLFGRLFGAILRILFTALLLLGTTVAYLFFTKQLPARPQRGRKG